MLLDFFMFIHHSCIFPHQGLNMFLLIYWKLVSIWEIGQEQHHGWLLFVRHLQLPLGLLLPQRLVGYRAIPYALVLRLALILHQHFIVQHMYILQSRADLGRAQHFARHRRLLRLFLMSILEQ